MQEDNIWQLQQAKAKFSAFVRAAEFFPQTITVHGKNRAILISWPYFLQMLKIVATRQQEQQPSLSEGNLTSSES